MRPVITARNVGKHYRLIHATTPRYRTLREDLAAWARNLSRGLWRRVTDEEFWALRGVDFDVQPGEVIGIIGRNGAGKSTLLKILARITPPTEGEVLMRGRVGSLLEVGTGFHPELTGRENIFLSGAILGMKRREVLAKFDEIVAFAEIEKFLDTPVKRYSSGMYVRLAFGVAAHLETEILLVDEVLAVGDAQFQKKSLNKIQSVARGGRTVLFVSHNMAAIQTFCQKGLLLSQGKTLAYGDIRSIVEKYSMLGNALEAEVAHLEEKPRPDYVDGRFRISSLRVNNLKPVCHNEPFTLELEARVDGAITELAVGFGFSAIDGTRFLSYDSDLLHERVALSGEDHLSVRVTIEELLLQPGLYSLDVGMRSGNSIALDYLASCAQIEVFPGPRTPPFLANGQPGVRAGALWRIKAGQKTHRINSGTVRTTAV
jgi:lipopolysaccharide transport system ATP-binding protein